jgi:hypothetical protein
MKTERINLKNQAEAVLHFFKKLDVDMVDQLLDSDRTYSDFDKQIFIRKLGLVFDQFIEAGDEYLILFPGKCGSDICDNAGCPGYAFIGNKSGKFLDLIVIEENGRITDIYDCTDFDSTSPQREPAKRIEIDSRNFWE